MTYIPGLMIEATQGTGACDACGRRRAPGEYRDLVRVDTLQLCRDCAALLAGRILRLAGRDLLAPGRLAIPDDFALDRRKAAGRCDACADYGDHGVLSMFVRVGHAQLCAPCALGVAAKIMDTAAGTGEAAK